MAPHDSIPVHYYVEHLPGMYQLAIAVTVDTHTHTLTHSHTHTLTHSHTTHSHTTHSRTHTLHTLHTHTVIGVAIEQLQYTTSEADGRVTVCVKVVDGTLLVNLELTLTTADDTALSNSTPLIRFTTFTSVHNYLYNLYNQYILYVI